MASEATAKRVNEKSDKGEKSDANAPAADAPLFNPLADLSRRELGILGALILLANLPVIHYFFRHVLAEMPTTVSVPLTDDFNRAEVGDNYFSTGGGWRIENGELHAPGVKNNPLWLKANLPDDVALEFDVRSVSQEGDIKFELFGDGWNHSSGYIFLFGGWNNQITAVARLNEHGAGFTPEGVGLSGQTPEQQAVAGRSLAELYNNGTYGKNAEWRVERHDVRVQPGRTYHMRVESKGGVMRWLIDGQLVFTVADKYPLRGKNHNRFAPSSWDSDLFFDNLVIQPL